MCLACLELARRKASAITPPPDGGSADAAPSARLRFVAEPVETAPRPPAKSGRRRDDEVGPR